MLSDSSQSNTNRSVLSVSNLNWEVKHLLEI